MQANRKLISIVFTDIEGYSALSQTHEPQAIEMVTKYHDIVSKFTSKHHGQVVNFMGDGSLTTHESCLDALQCAVAMQRAFQQNPHIPVRIGIHIGEVVYRQDTIYGNAVNVASRLHNLGIAGSVLVSGQVAGQIAHHPEMSSKYLGDEFVKNIKNPIAVHAVQSEGLVVPKWSQIHSKNKWRRQSTFWASIVIAAVLCVLFAPKIFNFASDNKNSFTERRILVLPFENATGDSSLNFIGRTASYYLTRELGHLENADIVPYDAMMLNKDDDINRFGTIPNLKIRKMTLAENVIHGQYRYLNDSTLLFTAAMRHASTWDYITHFDDQPVPLTAFEKALAALVQDIAGYWQSKDKFVLSTPNKDALNATSQALTYWGTDYDKALEYLNKAIAYDSNFTDAYFYIVDVYNNQWQLEKADSALNNITGHFSLQDFKPRELRRYRYSRALLDGRREEAFKILSVDYEKHKSGIFMNTSMAVNALYHVNEPERTLTILNEIPFDSLDFAQSPYWVYRITMAVQASYAIGRFDDAVRYASYYPPDSLFPENRQMKIRAYAAAGDTTAVNRELRYTELIFGIPDYRAALYWTAKQYQLLKQPELQKHYLGEALEYYDNYRASPYGHILYDLERYQEGFDHFKKMVAARPDSKYSLYGLGRGHAHLGHKDSTIMIIDKLSTLRKPRFDYGEIYYLQARLYTSMGDYSSAMVKLEQAILDGQYFQKSLMDNDPALLPLFELDEFQRITHPLRY